MDVPYVTIPTPNGVFPMTREEAARLRNEISRRLNAEPDPNDIVPPEFNEHGVITKQAFRSFFEQPAFAWSCHTPNDAGVAFAKMLGVFRKGSLVDSLAACAGCGKSMSGSRFWLAPSPLNGCTHDEALKGVDAFALKQHIKELMSDEVTGLNYAHKRYFEIVVRYLP